MPVLQFKGRFRDAIASGDKTQTIRARLPRGFAVGRQLTLMNGYKADATIGRAEILAVDRVTVKELSEADARAGGSQSLVHLRAGLTKLYGERASFWRIRWGRLRAPVEPARRRAS